MEKVKGMKGVVMICAAIFPFLVCSGIVYTILSLYMAELGTTKSQIGLFYTLSASAGAVASPLLGRFADRVGRKPLLLGSMGTFAVVFGGFALATRPEDLIAIMLLEGMGWGALGTSASAMIADLVPSDKRGVALGLYNTAWNLGWIIGPVTGGFLSDLLGFRKTFLLASSFILLGLLLGVFLIPKGLPSPTGSGYGPDEGAQGS